MDRPGVTIYVNVARDEDTPVWLRVGVGLVRPDGSLLAHLDHLPTDGRIRVVADQPLAGMPIAARRGVESPRPPARIPRAARRPPPPPAARGRTSRAQEEGP
jgi:hypothetical protein